MSWYQIAADAAFSANDPKYNTSQRQTGNDLFLFVLLRGEIFSRSIFSNAVQALS
jgi:hypothetical protein